MPLRHCPSRIYKYFGTQPEVIDSLTQGFLRYSPLGAFNDPFEGVPCLTGLTDDASMEKTLNEIFSRDALDPELAQLLYEVADDYYGKIPKEEVASVTIEDFRAMLWEVCQQNKAEILQAIKMSPSMIMKVLSQKFDKHIGACSFSEVPDNLLMWAHYGAWHKGFVVEFDAHHPYFHEQRTPDEELNYLRQVRYRSSRTSSLLSELSVPELFLVKSEHWLYEREWRVLRPFEKAARVVPNQDCPIHLFSFPLGAVTSVVLGSRIKPDTEAHVRQFMAEVSLNGNAKLKRAEPDESHFVLHIRNI